MDLAADGSLPKTKIRERLHRIADERAKLEEQLEGCGDQLEVGAALIDAALKLLEDPATLYRESGPNFRRTLNQTIFEKLYIDNGEVSGEVMREPFGTLKAVATAYAADPNLGRRRRPAIDASASTTDLLIGALAGKGSCKTLMVETMVLWFRTSRTDVARHRGHSTSVFGCQKRVWSSLLLLSRVDPHPTSQRPTALLLMGLRTRGPLPGGRRHRVRTPLTTTKDVTKRDRPDDRRTHHRTPRHAHHSRPRRRARHDQLPPRTCRQGHTRTTQPPAAKSNASSKP